MSEYINKKYPLGEKYQGIFLNHREAICVQYLLKNFNITQIANKMKLSLRTINFYIWGIMLKVECDSLDKMLDCVKQSELLKYLNLDKETA